MYSTSMIKGTLQPIILKLLKERKRMYGYEITQVVRDLTNGKVAITEGALYPALHKLEAEGVLKTEKEYIGKRVRKYYSLTRSGNSIVAERVNELADFISSMSLILNSKSTV